VGSPIDYMSLKAFSCSAAVAIQMLHFITDKRRNAVG
jgi:hypothetical protein